MGGQSLRDLAQCVAPTLARMIGIRGEQFWRNAMGLQGEQTTYGASVGKQCKSEAKIILCNDKDIYIYISV